MGQVNNAAGLANDPVFQRMALAALVYQARQVFGEAADTPDHARRLGFAMRVIRNPAEYLDTITWTMAADPTISTATTVAQVNEGTLLTAVQGAWNYLAGI